MENIGTKSRIKEVILDLMKRKPIDRIKVTEIIEVLQVSRSTFYLYFDSVFDAVQEIEDDLIAGIEPIKKAIMSYPFLDQYFMEPHPGIIEILNYSKNNYDSLSTLFGMYGDSVFVHKCKKMIQQVFFEKAINEKYIKLNDEHGKFALVFMVGGHLELVFYWIKNGLEMSDDELAILVYRMMFGAWRSNLF